MSKNKSKTTFFVKSAMKAYAKKKGAMVGSDSYDAFNKAIGDAIARTKANKRKTLKAQDF
jgi:hypothetical protein